MSDFDAFSAYHHDCWVRFAHIAVCRIRDMGFRGELRPASVCVPFGDRALMLQDYIRCAGEAMVRGELTLALRYVIKARSLDLSLDALSSDALDIITQHIEMVLDSVEVLLDPWPTATSVPS